MAVLYFKWSEMSQAHHGAAMCQQGRGTPHAASSQAQESLRAPLAIAPGDCSCSFQLVLDRCFHGCRMEAWIVAWQQMISITCTASRYSQTAVQTCTGPTRLRTTSCMAERVLMTKTCAASASSPPRSAASQLVSHMWLAQDKLFEPQVAVNYANFCHNPDAHAFSGASPLISP